MNHLRKRETLIEYYRKLGKTELPKISPPNLSSPKKTIRKFMIDGTVRRVIMLG